MTLQIEKLYSNILLFVFVTGPDVRSERQTVQSVVAGKGRVVFAEIMVWRLLVVVGVPSFRELCLLLAFFGWMSFASICLLKI